MMVSFLGFWLVMGIIVAILAANKGRSWPLWLIYGFLVWPVALVHVLVLKPTPEYQEAEARRQGLVKCPHCAEMIKAEAKVCPHCQRDVAGPPGAAAPE